MIPKATDYFRTRTNQELQEEVRALATVGVEFYSSRSLLIRELLSRCDGEEMSSADRFRRAAAGAVLNQMFLKSKRRYAGLQLDVFADKLQEAFLRQANNGPIDC